MTHHQRRTKQKTSSATSTKDRILDSEESIPIPSRQDQLNEQTDFAVDPALIFDELPQPFRRINKVLESIFDDAWAIIEQREKQRSIDQTKFVSAQHTSSTPIETSLPVTLIGSHLSGTLCFFHSIENDRASLICYDNQVDEILNEINLDQPLKHLIVFKSDPSAKDNIYYFSVIDTLGYWKMFAYKNQQYYLLFTQYETEDESKRPTCVMTQTGLNDEYLVVTWFGNNDSSLEVYKINKDQWRSEIATQEQAMLVSETNTEENTTTANPSTEKGPTLIRGQFTRPTLLFKAKAPKFGAGSNNIQQLMKTTENPVNIGQGVSNHFYTQQIIDGKTILIREMVAPMPKMEGVERPFVIPKSEPSSAMIPLLCFMPTTMPSAGGVPSLAVSWPTTSQLLIYKIVKSESKGKDAADTRPINIWPFASYISSLAYDSKHEHLAVALQSGNVCIIERTTGVNELPSVQHISSSSIVDIHSLDIPTNPNASEKQEKNNGFLVLSNDGHIYRVKFCSLFNENRHDIHQNVTNCFPQEQSKDTSKIVRMIHFDCHSSNLFLSINESNRIYINDGVKCKQLCEIVLSQSQRDEENSFQIALLDQARSIIIGVPEKTIRSSDDDPPEHVESRSLRLYRVPLEHFPSLASYYPERVVLHNEETDSLTDIKPTKLTSSHAKKATVVVEIDKTALMFDEKIKELFRKRQSEAYERRERLRTRWNEIKLHFNPVYEQST